MGHCVNLLGVALKFADREPFERLPEPKGFVLPAGEEKIVLWENAYVQDGSVVGALKLGNLSAGLGVEEANFSVLVA